MMGENEAEYMKEKNRKTFKWQSLAGVRVVEVKENLCKLKDEGN